MKEKLRLEIDTMIKGRILMYHNQLISSGQIKVVKCKNLTTNPQSSHYIQKEHMQRNSDSKDPVLRKGESIQTGLCEHEHE